MPGYKDWVDGVALPAADMDDYISKQVNIKLATAAARDAAITGAIKREGMIIYQDDTNCIMVSRDGTAGNYSTIGPVHGALTSWTPTVTQSGSVAVTVSRATYRRIGRQIDCQMYLSVTGTGTAANAVIIGGLPFATVAAQAFTWGSGYLYDASGPNYHPFHPAVATTTTIALHASNAGVADPRLGVAQFTAALASGDLVVGGFSYEAAADA